MINFEIASDPILDSLITTFDETTDYIRTEYGIELKTYGNYLRIAFNCIQKEGYSDLIQRVNLNRELEKALDNAGGYTIESLEAKNPKSNLIEIFEHLKRANTKSKRLINLLNSSSDKKTIITETNDIDYLVKEANNNKLKIITLSEFKKSEQQFKNLLF